MIQVCLIITNQNDSSINAQLHFTETQQHLLPSKCVHDPMHMTYQSIHKAHCPPLSPSG